MFDDYRLNRSARSLLKKVRKHGPIDVQNHELFTWAMSQSLLRYERDDTDWRDPTDRSFITEAGLERLMELNNRSFSAARSWAAIVISIAALVVSIFSYFANA
jgi:hypothetical protein